jgi:hypothetical protein
MLKPGKMHEIAAQMLKTQLQIIALQEMRWKGSVQIKKDKYSLYYSCSQQHCGQLGTGFMVKREIIKNMISFQPYNEKICKLRMRGKYHNLTLINVHAPTKDKDVRVKEQLYDDLQGVYENTAKHDVNYTWGPKCQDWKRTSLLAGICSAHFASLFTPEW